MNSERGLARIAGSMYLVGAVLGGFAEPRVAQPALAA